MVKHKKKPDDEKSHYWVMAKLCEPKYESELAFVRTEVAFAERKIVERKASLFREWSLPAAGFFHHKAWRKYVSALEHYANLLEKYRGEVAGGVLPVKFVVHNQAEINDERVKVGVHVKNGRVDTDKKAPERPERLDGRGKPNKFSWPKLSGFSRGGIKITAHTVVAEFSTLGPSDGAVLVNQLVHVHTEPDTLISYQISSRNVAHETGEVEI